MGWVLIAIRAIVRVTGDGTCVYWDWERSFRCVYPIGTFSLNSKYGGGFFFFFFFFWASVQVDFEMCLPCSAFQQIERTVEKGSYVLLAKSAGMTCKMMLQNQNIFQPSDQLLAVQLNDAEQKVVCSRGPSRAFKRLQETSYALLTRASSTVQLVHDHPSLHRVVRGRG
jgi:hypothetical protein